MDVNDFFDEVDDEKSYPSSWNAVRDKMCELGVESLPYVYQWHKEHTPIFDDWTNYLLSLTYFKDDIDKDSKRMKEVKKQLEKQVKLDMKRGKTKPSIVQQNLQTEMKTLNENKKLYFPFECDDLKQSIESV